MFGHTAEDMLLMNSCKGITSFCMQAELNSLKQSITSGLVEDKCSIHQVRCENIQALHTLFTH